MPTEYSRAGLVRELWSFIKDKLHRRWVLLTRPAPPPPFARQIAGAISENGFTVLPGFLDATEIAGIHGWFQQVSQGRHDESLFKDQERLRVGYAGPHFDRDRWYEQLAPLFAHYGTLPPTPLIYERRQEHASNAELVTDTYHIDGIAQTLVGIVYLTEVGPRQAPFCLLRNTHGNRWWKLMAEFLFWLYFSQENKTTYLAGSFQINFIHLVKSFYRLEEVTILGKPGDVILFDASSVHRSTPLQEGRRDALFINL